MSISANVSFRECCGNCKERPTWLASRATARQPPQVVAYALSFVSQTRRLARRLRRRGEAMPAHDVGHLDSVGRSEGGGVDHRGGLTKELGTDRGRRDGTQDPRVLAAMVVESVNRAARNAEGLPWPDVDPGAVDGPRQYALDAVDRFLVVIVAVRRCRESLRARNGEFEESDAAARVFSRDQEANGERAEVDGFLGRINVNGRRLRCPRNLQASVSCGPPRRVARRAFPLL